MSEPLTLDQLTQLGKGSVEVTLPGGATVRVEGEGVATEAVKAVWDSSFISKLPDTSFLHVEAGGKKKNGITHPVSLRHFPVKDAAGKVDLPHLRNALARIPQSKLPQAVKDDCTARAKKMLEAEKPTNKSAFESSGRLIRKADEPAGIKLHRITAVVLEPCTAEATKDTQGDYYTEEDIFVAMSSFMKKQGVGLMHHNPDVRGFRLIENWQEKAGFIPSEHGMVGDEPVLKGTWLQTHELDEEENPEAWAGVVSGEYTAFSIEGNGTRIPVEPE
jgi:hypothetical protein